ncbi:MAG: P1 family peptidase [Nitrospinae bacterium]|nr:P1 family peptidase [Nitrospinota bacterium]
MPGVRIGHWSSETCATGCTAVVFEKSSPASVHVAGGAPGSQETDLLEPSRLVAGVDAIVLTGGSAFGLAAAAGARRYLEEKGRGFSAGGIKVPIVPAAVIFDLVEGSGGKRPGPDEGYAACVASERQDFRDGRIGAGTGATVGKYMGLDKRSPGGLACRMVTMEDGVTAGAVMVVNCYGAVTDPQSGKIIAGPRDEKGGFIPYLGSSAPSPDFGNTVIGVVFTDAALTKAELQRTAVMAHDGIARAVNPSHTPYDGDMIFAVSVGERKGDVCRIGAWFSKLVEECVAGAVKFR